MVRHPVLPHPVPEVHLPAGRARRRRARLMSSIGGWSGKPPTASEHLPRRTKMAWSPATRRERRFIGHHAQMRGAPVERTSAAEHYGMPGLPGLRFASHLPAGACPHAGTTGCLRRTPPHRVHLPGAATLGDQRGSPAARDRHRVVANAAVHQHDLAAAVTPSGGWVGQFGQRRPRPHRHDDGERNRRPPCRRRPHSRLQRPAAQTLPAVQQTVIGDADRAPARSPRAGRADAIGKRAAASSSCPPRT